jgi:hypothetical protein
VSDWNKDFFVAKRKTYKGSEQIIFNTKGNSIVVDSFIFSHEVVKLKVKSNWGVFDKELQEIIPTYYQKITANGDQYIVNFKDQYGVINQKNEWVIPPLYREIKPINNTHYKIVDKYLREFIADGKQKYEAKLYYDFYGEYGIEQDVNRQFRLIDQKGNVISDFRNGTYSGHGETGILFRNGDQHILLNKLGEVLFRINKYDTIIASDDEYLAIKKSGKWGFINEEGILRIANRYDSVRSFNDNKSAIKIRNAWGFINRQEDIVVQPYYSEVSNFKHNTAFVRFNSKYGLIDERGDFIIEAEYDEIVKEKEFYLLRKGSKWGIANSQGKMITYPTYDNIIVGDDFLEVEKYGNVRILSIDGTNLINQQYDNIYYDQKENLFLAKKLAKREQVFLTDILTGKYP